MKLLPCRICGDEAVFIDVRGQYYIKCKSHCVFTWPFNKKEDVIKIWNRKVENKNKKTFLPKDFEISENVKQWAKEKGFENLEDHLENFKLVSQAKGYKYINWDRAFMNAIRKNWADIKPMWADIPKDSMELVSWAKNHKYPAPLPGQTFSAYRAKLKDCVNARKQSNIISSNHTSKT